MMMKSDEMRRPELSRNDTDRRPVADFLKIKFLRFGLVKTLSICTLPLFINGCGDRDTSDLTAFITQVKARPKTQIEPLPEVKVIEPFIFKPDGLRDPFRPNEKVEQDVVGDISPGSGIKPDITRRKEELEAYSLDALRMAGTVNMNNERWGLVKASDGTIHRVRVGNYMGKNYGKIIRIVEDKIELMEIVPDTPGTRREQQTSLALAE